MHRLIFLSENISVFWMQFIKIKLCIYLKVLYSKKMAICALKCGVSIKIANLDNAATK